MSTRTHPLPNLRPLAVAIVREAIAARPTADVAGVGTMIRRRTLGWSKLERLRLVTVLALLAGDIASRLPPDHLDEAFALAGMSDDDLARLAVGLVSGRGGDDE